MFSSFQFVSTCMLIWRAVQTTASVFCFFVFVFFNQTSEKCLIPSKHLQASVDINLRSVPPEQWERICHVVRADFPEGSRCSFIKLSNRVEQKGKESKKAEIKEALRRKKKKREGEKSLCRMRRRLSERRRIMMKTTDFSNLVHSLNSALLGAPISLLFLFFHKSSASSSWNVCVCVWAASPTRFTCSLSLSSCMNKQPLLNVTIKQRQNSRRVRTFSTSPHTRSSDIAALSPLTASAPPGPNVLVYFWQIFLRLMERELTGISMNLSARIQRLRPRRQSWSYARTLGLGTELNGHLYSRENGSNANRCSCQSTGHLHCSGCTPGSDLDFLFSC